MKILFCSSCFIVKNCCSCERCGSYASLHSNFFSTYILEFKNINIKTNFKVGKTKNIKSLQYKHLICHLALASVNQNLGHTSTLNNPNHRHSTTSICTKLTHINMYDHSTCISIGFLKLLMF